MKKKFGIFL